jgi:uncharacterized protein YuzE
MKITYDSEVDALYIRFAEGPAEVITRQLSDDIALNSTGDGRIVGIEILDASEHGFRAGPEQTVVVHNLAPASA